MNGWMDMDGAKNGTENETKLFKFYLVGAK